MKGIIKIIWVLAITLMYSLMAMGQDNSTKYHPDYYQTFTASYILGAQIFNDNFIYNPGYSFDATCGAFVNKNLGLAMGLGYREFESESFVPIYAEILGKKKSKSSAPFIKMQVGYSAGWHTSETEINGYSFKGGLLIGAGMGRKIKINDNYSVLFNWTYQHQFAKMEYDIFATTDYTETLNYDMIVISLGLMRHK